MHSLSNYGCTFFPGGNLIKFEQKQPAYILVGKTDPGAGQQTSKINWSADGNEKPWGKLRSLTKIHAHNSSFPSVYGTPSTRRSTYRQVGVLLRKHSGSPIACEQKMKVHSTEPISDLTLKTSRAGVSMAHYDHRKILMHWQKAWIWECGFHINPKMTRLSGELPSENMSSPAAYPSWIRTDEIGANYVPKQNHFEFNVGDLKIILLIQFRL